MVRESRPRLSHLPYPLRYIIKLFGASRQVLENTMIPSRDMIASFTVSQIVLALSGKTHVSGHHLQKLFQTIALFFHTSKVTGDIYQVYMIISIFVDMQYC